MNQVRYVGLDVHRREVTACVVDAQGKVLGRSRFALTRASLQGFARAVLHGRDEVALEATTNSWAVVGVLKPCVAQVVVSNPLATKAIAQSKIKTDKVDAQVLAQLLRCGYLPTVWEPDEATQQWRQLTGRRASLVQERTALANRLSSVLAMRLIVPPAGGLLSHSGRVWLREVLQEGDLDAEGRLLIESDWKLLEAIEEELASFDQLLAERGYQDERVKLLMTLPGVDVTVAGSLRAALGEIQRFRTPDQAASYLGLVPSTRQSAAHCYHGPITKRGNKQARWMLVQAAQCVGRHPGPLGHFFRRLKRRKNHNVAVVATARKLVVIAWHMLSTGEPYRYAVPRSTETKLSRLRVRATGRKRRSGPRAGDQATAKLPGGSRTIKSLDRLYAEEGLPPRRPVACGEARVIDASGSTAFVTSLASDQVIPRRGACATRVTADPAAGGPAPSDGEGSPPARPLTAQDGTTH